jgi:hypothetical protein
MKIKTSKTPPKKRHPEGGSRWMRRVIALVAVSFLAAALLGVSLVQRNRKYDEQLQMLVDRWMRPDGGYVLDIRDAKRDGTLDVAYYNPRPINVSNARVTRQDKRPYLFIELTDVGYPGATYDLRYDAQEDALFGVYFQPSVNEYFEVVFVRME